MARKPPPSKNLRKKAEPPVKEAKAKKPAAPAKPAPASKAASAAKPAKGAKEGKSKEVKKDAKSAAAKSAAPAKDAPPKKKRSKSGGVRLKAYWGVFNQMMKRVAMFEYAERKLADKKAAELGAGGKTPHFVQLVKEVIRDAD